MSTRLPTRRLVTELIARRLPPFAGVEGRKPWFWFRQSALTEWFDSMGTPLHHTILIAHSAKEKCFTADVHSGLLPVPSLQYGGHVLRRLCSLPALRLGSRAVPAEESWYSHD